MDIHALQELVVLLFGLLCIVAGFFLVSQLIAERWSWPMAILAVVCICAGILAQVYHDDIYSDPLSIRVENDSDDTVHMVLMIDDNITVDTTMAPERYWFDGSDVSKTQYYDDALEAGAHTIIVSFNIEIQAEFPVKVSFGDKVSIRLNTDGSISFWLNGEPQTEAVDE